MKQVSMVKVGSGKVVSAKTHKQMRSVLVTPLPSRAAMSRAALSSVVHRQLRKVWRSFAAHIKENLVAEMI